MKHIYKLLGLIVISTMATVTFAQSFIVKPVKVLTLTGSVVPNFGSGAAEGKEFSLYHEGGAMGLNYHPAGNNFLLRYYLNEPVIIQASFNFPNRQHNMQGWCYYTIITTQNFSGDYNTKITSKAGTNGVCNITKNGNEPILTPEFNGRA